MLLDKNELIKEYVDIATRVMEDRNKKILESWYEFCKLQFMCEKPTPLGVGWIAL